MPDAHSDLVIYISTAEPTSEASAANREKGDGQLVQELRQCLQPGAEISLILDGFVATTSILWLSGPLEEGGLRAGVRLLAVSALPAEKPEVAAWDRSPQSNVRVGYNASVAAHL